MIELLDNFLGGDDITQELIDYAHEKTESFARLISARMSVMFQEFDRFVLLLDLIPELYPHIIVPFRLQCQLYDQKKISRSQLQKSPALFNYEAPDGSDIEVMWNYSEQPSYVRKKFTIPTELQENGYALLKQLRKVPGFGSKMALAISNDDIDTVNLLYSSDDFKPERTYEGYSPIVYSILWNSLKCFKFFLLNGFSLKDCMSTAVSAGRVEMIEMLEQSCQEYRGCARLAVDTWHNNILSWLLETSRDDTSVKNAIQACNYEAIDILMDKGILPTPKDITFLVGVRDDLLLRCFNEELIDMKGIYPPKSEHNCFIFRAALRSSIEVVWYLVFHCHSVQLVFDAVLRRKQFEPLVLQMMLYLNKDRIDTSLGRQNISSLSTEAIHFLESFNCGPVFKTYDETSNLFFYLTHDHEPYDSGFSAHTSKTQRYTVYYSIH